MITHFLKPKRKKIFWVLLVTCFSPGLFSGIVIAQIVITSPLNNQIMQRCLKDSASISVTGYLHQPYETVKISLTEKSNSIPAQTFLIDNSQLSQGFFSVIIKAKTGWHHLQIEATTTNGTIDSASVGNVGVGEVFLVAGNSNAMGLPDLGARAPSENIVTFNEVNKFLNSEDITVAPNLPMQLPVFSQVKADGFLFPSGETSWYWGELGDLLYARLKTPVLFLNAAWAAANSVNYRDAASGKDAYNMYVGKNWPNLQPYSNLSNTLKYLHSWLGIRGVLWSHGENDAVHLKIDQESYFSNIQYLVRRSREDFGVNVPWLIALNSVGATLDKPYLPVTLAQTALTKIPKFNVWPGPDMDTIQIPRPSHGHFENVIGGTQGLSLAAKAWNRSLSDSLLKIIVPIQPQFFIHTGVAPSAVFPGATFSINFQVSPSPPDTIQLQAELLDVDGKFVALVGSGTQSPIAVKLPQELPAGSYRVRLTASKPVLPGTVSEVIIVNRGSQNIQFSRPVVARIKEQEISLSWLVAASPGLERMILQKSVDRENYLQISEFKAINNTIISHVYSGTDNYSNEETVFYRVEFQYQNGKKSFSAAIVIFGKHAPPPFVVFPNPVTDQKFYIRTETSEKYSSALFDMMGREYSLQSSDHEIIGLTELRPLYALPSGKYILRITTDTGISTQTVVFR